MASSRAESSSNNNTSSNEKGPIFTGQLPHSEKLIELKEYGINVSSDLLFSILNISRIKFSRILQDLFLKDSKLFKNIHQEIYEAFITYESKTAGREGLLPQKKWYSLSQELTQARLVLNNQLQEIHKTLPYETQKLDLKPLIAWLKSNQEAKVGKSLESKLLKVEKAQTKLHRYCQDSSIIRYYIEEFKKTLKPGCVSMLLFAAHANINCYVWKLEETQSSLTFVDGYNMGDETKDTLHLLQTEHFTLNPLIDPKTQTKETELSRSIIASMNEGQSQVFQLLLGATHYKKIYTLAELRCEKEHNLWQELLRIRFTVLKIKILSLISDFEKNQMLPSEDCLLLTNRINQLFQFEKGFPLRNAAEIHLPAIRQLILSKASPSIFLSTDEIENSSQTFEKDILDAIRKSPGLNHFNEFGPVTGRLSQRFSEQQDNILKFPVITESPLSLRMLLVEFLKSLDSTFQELCDGERELKRLRAAQSAKENAVLNVYQNKLRLLFEDSGRLFRDPLLSQVSGNKLQVWQNNIEQGSGLLVRTLGRKNLLELLCTSTDYKPNTDLGQLLEECARYLIFACFVEGNTTLLSEAFIWLYKKMDNPEQIHINDKIFAAIFDAMNDYYEGHALNILENPLSKMENNILTETNRYLNRDYRIGQIILNKIRRKEKIEHFNQQAIATRSIIFHCNATMSDEGLMGFIYFHLFKDVKGWDYLFHPFIKELHKDVKHYYETSKKGDHTFGYAHSMRYELEASNKRFEESERASERKDKIIEEERKARLAAEEKIKELLAQSKSSSRSSSFTSQPKPKGKEKADNSDEELSTSDPSNSIPLLGRRP